MRHGFGPYRTFSNIWKRDHQIWSGECAIGIWWIKAKDVAKYSTMHRTTPHNKEFSIPQASIVLSLETLARKSETYKTGDVKDLKEVRKDTYKQKYPCTEQQQNHTQFQSIRDNEDQIYPPALHN